MPSEAINIAIIVIIGWVILIIITIIIIGDVDSCVYCASRSSLNFWRMCRISCTCARLVTFW